ncbi:hypothetical protein DE146DRAFT_752334 [Phaeosphaeria sp. MPI-PUGE-AT-0046c]|nr:hypothetical protein DE146DRAFT_752334 [Phaeosphaeria sp. MPI-PUGE-AT-0046c]
MTMPRHASGNNAPAHPMVHFKAGPSPDSTIVRITHHKPPDLSYEVRVRPVPTGPSNPNPPLSTHTIDNEPSMVDFPTSTFSFNNYGPFAHFLSQHSPASVASITKVQWEAHDAVGVAGGATLTVAKMLIEKLPGLKEVVIRLFMERSVATGEYVGKNREKWVDGLKGLKKGLRVAVVTTNPKAFERGMKGGSVRGVNKNVKRKGAARNAGVWH